MNFGRTYNRRFLHRISLVIREIILFNRRRALFTNADVVIARNLEMLAIAVRGKSLCHNVPIVFYECLDIHRLLLDRTLIGSTLRALEGWLARRASALITSSPAFIGNYFNTQSSVRLPVVLLENKVFQIQEKTTCPVMRHSGPPWIIGWFGIIRCKKSLQILNALVHQSQGKVEVVIRGRPALDQFDDFYKSVSETPGIKFLGTYLHPDDLAEIYRNVHFNWTIDLYEEGFNSSWLLPKPMHIIIVDGGSVDQTPIIAKDLAQQHPNIVHYLHNPKRLQAAGINRAISTYGHLAKYFIRLDAHADYPDNYCSVLIDEAKRTQAASVVVAVNTVGTRWFQKAVATAQNSRLGNGGSAHRSKGYKGMYVDHGHHALMRIDAFRSTGGYDELFSHNEDGELDIRFNRAGYKIWLTEKTAMTYYPRSSPLALIQQYFNYGFGRARNMTKHHTNLKLRQLAPTFVVPALILFCVGPFFFIATWPAIIWITICLGYGLWLALKARHLYNLAAGPAAMLMHMGWSAGFWSALLLPNRTRT